VLQRDLDTSQQAWLAARRHRLEGLDLHASHLRAYPLGAGAAHLVGYISEVGHSDLLHLDDARYRAGDQVGRRGLERSEEPHLAGLPGRAAALVDALGRPTDGQGPWHEALLEARDHRQRPAVPGADVYLSLDSEVQQATWHALGERRGAAVMLDVHSGALLAYASSPAYDPAELVRGVGRARWKELTDAGPKPLVDRNARGLYPPASTFKVVTAAAAMEHGVRSDFTVTCNGGYQVGRRRFRCWKRGGHGVVDLRSALMGSCDVWFYVAGLEVGVDKLAEMASRLGLGRPTGLELNGERGGLVPSRDFMRRRYGQEWTIGDTASAAIGQGINLATPLQLARMTAAVANGGELVTPWVVQRVVGPEGSTVYLGGAQETQPTDLSTEVLQALRGGLEAVVMDDKGTARSVRIEGMPFAGKTGTAQTVSAKLKAERPGPETEDHALFVAYAPLEDPQVAVAVVMEHAGGGSTHAAPVARQMLQAWGRVEGLLPPQEAAP
jgi:penicillin-binding protein 2